MADTDRTVVEYSDGSDLPVHGALNDVETELMAARGDGKFCRLITDLGNVEILINPDHVRALRPAPGGTRAF
jgi:hypothetical protein